MKKIELLKGQRFGNLTITGKTKIKKFKHQKHKIYEVICDCGKKVFVFKENLLSGFTKRCIKCRYIYASKNHTDYPKIRKQYKLSKRRAYYRIGHNIPLDFPLRKHFNHIRKLNQNSMAGLARLVGKSREMIRQLYLKGLTKEQILERYNKNT